VTSTCVLLPNSILTRKAFTYASLVKADRSAPENPSNSSLLAIETKSTSEERGTFLQQVLSICKRSYELGNGTYNSLSSLPGLSIAGSIMSGLLVAAITNTPTRSSNPSISVSN